MPGIGIITNPKARRNRNRPWIRDRLVRIVGDVGRVYETRSIAELPGVAEEFIKRDFDVLAVNGGDGTAHISLTNFIHVYGDRPLPKLLNLRAGTMNTISKAIKHKGKTENILASVVRKVRDGKTLDIVRQPVLNINDRYGFMWGFGVVGNFLEAYYKGSSLGPWQAFKVVARTVASAIFRTPFAKDMFAPYPSHLTLDGVPMELPLCRGVVVSSIKEIGLGFKLTYRAYEKPGYVHARGTTLKPYQFALLVPYLFFERRINNDGIIDEIAREFVLETKDNPPYTIDGELYRDTNVFRIRQGPVIQVIREGVKKPPAGIGLPEYEAQESLPEHIDAKETEKDTDTHSCIDTPAPDSGLRDPGSGLQAPESGLWALGNAKLAI